MDVRKESEPGTSAHQSASTDHHLSTVTLQGQGQVAASTHIIPAYELVTAEQQLPGHNFHMLQTLNDAMSSAQTPSNIDNIVVSSVHHY